MRRLLFLFLGMVVLVACGGKTSAFELEVGQCFNTGDVEGVAEVALLDCATAHDAEVFHLQDIPGDDFPGDVAVRQFADEACNAAFQGYVGSAYEGSRLLISYLFPTAQTWAEGDHEVVCLLGGGDSQLTGSMKDSKQ